VDALERQLAGVDEAGIALGAGHGHFAAVVNAVQRIAGTDDGGNAKLARDDRGVAGASAAVGDDGGGALHHRFPVRVGHVGDQHVTGLHALHVPDRTHHARDAAADLLSDRAAFRQHRAALFQLEAFNLRGMRARLHGFRARLHDVELAGATVLAPTRCPSGGRSAARWSGPARELLHVVTEAEASCDARPEFPRCARVRRACPNTPCAAALNRADGAGSPACRP
jgi:hypothetical protein